MQQVLHANGDTSYYWVCRADWCCWVVDIQDCISTCMTLGFEKMLCNRCHQIQSSIFRLQDATTLTFTVCNRLILCVAYCKKTVHWSISFTATSMLFVMRSYASKGLFAMGYLTLLLATQHGEVEWAHAGVSLSQDHSSLPAWQWVKHQEQLH